MKGKGDKMKKLVSLILCLAMAIAWLPAGSPFAAAADSPFDGGSGTADDPYLVSTPEQLKAVADYPESCFLQTADIDLNTGYSLSGAADLNGTYDGGGHRIIGYQGSIHNGYSIFRYNYGTIRNLGLFACRIAIETRFNDNVFPDKSMGLLTIYNYGTIENCYIEDTHTTITLNNKIKWETDAPEMDIGGFSAVNTGTIRNCYVTGYIRVYSDFYYVSPGRRIDMREGGITAINGETGRVENCFVSCDIFESISPDIEGTRWVGLFCGENNGTVTGCCSDISGSTTNDHGTGTYEVQQKTGAEVAEYLNQQNDGIPYWGWGSSTDDDDEPVLNYRELGASSSLPSGVYDLPVTDVALSLNLPNENAELYYEIKGSGEGKQPYTQPLTITGETELFVYGQLKASDKIYQVTYYHYWDRPSPVTATPEERVQSQPVKVELSTASEGAKIWYTLDGTDPTESENRFDYELNGPIRIIKRTTITAVAEVDGIYGPVERFEYVISPPITASPQAGGQTGPIEVELKCELEDYDIYYTTDGLDPTQYGTEYTQPIPIFQTTDLKVVPKIDDQFGEVTTFHYEYSEAVITPSVPAGKYDGVQRLTLSCSPDYLDLYYTLDNGQQQHYQGETIHIYQTTTLTVYAKYQGQTVASQTFRYELPELEITAEPIQGTYAEIKTITLKSNPDDYALFYTLDGSDPADNGIRYQQPFELDHSATVRVCAKYGIKVVEGGPFSFEYTMDLPYVIAKTEPGASRAPLLVELEVSEGGYDIYYTLDGSDPKDSDIKYEGPFWINEPVTTVVRAVPKDKYFSDYGTTSQFCYTFPYQTFTVEKEKAEKHTDYELTLTVSNTLPEGKEVTFYAAAYLNGRMLGVAAEQAELPEGTENKSVTISYPYDGLLPDDAEFKVFCLDSKTRRPYCEPLTYAVSEVKVFQELASISVSPNPIVGQVGETVARPTVTAHYTNGKPDSVVSMNIEIKPDYDVVIVSYPSQNLIIEREGTGSITVSYSEGGITKSIEVPVTGVAPVANLGFLANPTADPLPEDAIPIYTAQELAAIGGAESAGKTYYLADDIRLTGEWEPIYNFRGTLDGRGHKVSGLYISSSSEKQLAGLFASAYDAVIKNLAVEVASQGISTSYSGGFDGTYAGALVADSNNTTFSNCYTTGGPVTARGIAPIAGGLVGHLDNSAAERVENCFSTCQVTAESPQAKSNTCKAGGLIGELKSESLYETAVVSRCYATGNVLVSHPGGGSGSAGTQAGGLLGSGNYLEIENCFALGDVTVRRTDTSTSSSVFAGGLGGWLSETTLDQCYAAGDVFGSSNSYVGGLTARAVSGSFTCYRVGQSVTGTTYYNGGDSVYMPPTQSSFPEFDFTTTWEITEGAFQGLPHLKYHR